MKFDGIRFRRAIVRAIPWTAVLLLPGCASSWRGPRGPEQLTLPRDPSTPTRLDRRLDAGAAGAAADSSSVSLLASGEDALYARLALTELAGRSIDVQTYIWDLDDSGRLLLARLLAAADRGVRVRLLLDDTATFRGERALAALDRHPNVEVRVFNPFRTRAGETWAERAIEFLVDFPRLNRRMHNKVWIFDGAWAIVGGRNVANHYFLLDEVLNFRDLDLLAAGPAGRDSAAAFDRYWNSRFTAPIAALARSKDVRLERLREKLARFEATQSRVPYSRRPTPEGAERALDGLLPSPIWARTEVLVDEPEKIAGGESSVIVDRLRAEATSIERELLVEVAYLSLGKDNVAELRALMDRGVRVRFLTNSLATNDVVAAHAGYVGTRRRLLEAGAELHELRPGARERSRFLSPSSGSKSSVHSKVVVFDRRHLFVGSLNLDPRSVLHNTEMGLLVDSPEIARHVAERIELGMLPDQSWRLELKKRRVRTTTGTEVEVSQVVWLGDPTGRIRTREPRATFWRRLAATVLSWLPIEGQV
jgi:putative cardiolipin synthase